MIKIANVTFTLTDGKHQKRVCLFQLHSVNGPYLSRDGGEVGALVECFVADDLGILRTTLKGHLPDRTVHLQGSNGEVLLE